MISQNKTRAKSIWTGLRKLKSNEKGVELIELAFALPILVLMLAGIFDFGEAWAMKDKLDGAARDGARVAVASFNDMNNPQCGGSPCMVQAAINAVLGTLTQAGVNTCGMTANGVAGAPYTWTDSIPCGNGGTFTVTVTPAVNPPVVDGSSGTDVYVMSTKVTVTYPYTVNFAQLFGATLTLTGTVTMANLN